MLAPNKAGWTREGDWVTSPGWRSADTKHFDDLGARLPEHADGAREIGISRFERFRLRVVPEGASRLTTIELDDGRAVYRDAWPSTDVVLTTTADRFEEFLVLRDERAPTEYTWTVNLPHGIPEVRQEPGGGIAFADSKGEVVFQVPPPVAISANGEQHPVELAWSAGQLVVRFNPAGLVYPVLVDPAFETSVWEQKSPATKPTPRYGFGLAYDSARAKTILYGGCSAPSSMPFLSDTWEWDGANWKKLAPATTPPANCFAGMAYDRDRERMVAFGGTVGGGLSAETWEWDGTNWEKRDPALSPPARHAHNLAYDSLRAKTILFGGNDLSIELADTWEWDGTNWEKMTPASSPSPRETFGFTFDGAREVVLLVGGNGGAGGGAGTDTWTWDGTNWRQEFPSATPFPCGGPGLSFDSARGVAILLPCFDGPVGTLWGNWEWDGSNWYQRTPVVSPRSGHGALAYDSGRRRTVLFGGGSGSGETWEHHVHGGACTLGSQCDTGFCVDNVCCEVDSCGTCQACNVAASPGVCIAVTNAADSDTCTGTKTCGPTGQCGLPNGKSCSLPGSCASGRCVDDACCNAACDGACDACDGASRGWAGAINGTCALAPTSYAGDPACGIYACSGADAACSSSCASDVECAAGYFCGNNGTCEARKVSGNSCDLASDCKSSPCRECSSTMGCKDGFCCSSSCTGACKTCGDTPGQCTDVTSADDPDTCTGASTCSVAGACLHKNGESCSAGAETCASGLCADGVCCNTACKGGCDVCDVTPGTCTTIVSGASGSDPSCSPYVCGGVASCPTTCTSDANCALGFYCSANGACTAQKSQGATCNDFQGQDCKTNGCRVCNAGPGTCSDGFCCNSACSGACDACDGAARGWPGAVNGSCSLAPTGFVGEPTCGAYACTGTSSTCAGATCAGDIECGANHYCDKNGSCQPRKTQGAVCSLLAGADCLEGNCHVCATGNCKDGYCCESGCSGGCQTCAVAPGTCSSVVGADDNTECAGTNTCNVSGECKKKTGRTCTVGTECSTGFCANGYCCDKACAGGCDVCDATPGTCAVVGAGNPGADPSCAPALCAGAAPNCPGGCQSDTDCAGTHYCSSSGTCLIRKSQGSTCSSAAGGDCIEENCRVCGSNHCVDGYCCDSACSGECDACAKALGATSDGSCAPVPKGSPGSPACSPYVCAGNSDKCPGGCAADQDCTANRYCAADGVCKPRKSAGTACNAAAGVDCLEGGCRVCTTGNCSDDICCDAACSGGCDACKQSLGATRDGTCTVLAQGAVGENCGPYLCTGQGSACPNSGTCSADSDCTVAHFCDATGVCQAHRLKGQSCTTSNECVSVDGNPHGYCVDGVCCDSDCGGCMACSAALKVSGQGDGTCDFAKKGLDPHDSCDPESQSTCGHTGQCDGAGDCQLWPQNTACGATFCTLNNVTGKVCSGVGVCVDVTALPCSPYLCQNSACTSPCDSSAQCDTGYYCLGGVCSKKEANARPCMTGDTCDSGFCTDGVCCDAPCSGQCEACAMAGSVGVCEAVKGTPIAPRADCTGAPPCQGSCDGGDRTACSYPDQATACGGPAKCTGDVVLLNPHCDGSGACTSAEQQTCAPYSCDADKAECRDQCVSDADCAAGATCELEHQRCAPAGNTCSDAYTVKRPSGEETSCAPYRCLAGACQQQCSGDPDCAAGYACVNAACEKSSDASTEPTNGGEPAGGSATSPAKQDSGCGCRVAGAPSRQPGSLLAVCALLATAALAGRRRRRVRDGWRP